MHDLLLCSISYAVVQKRRAVWRLGGDIRGEGADILMRLWEALAWPESTESGSVSQGVRIFHS
jgi:hypothetical protein